MKQLIKSITLSIFLLITTYTIAQQNNNLPAGTVTDLITKLPLENATLLLQPEEVTTTSNAAGYFEFKISKSKKQTVTISLVGYATKTVGIDMDKPTTILLQKRIVGLQEVVVTSKQKIVGSTSTIDKSAIIHTQPTSLADVLQLVPGQLAVNPKLGVAQQITLRQVTSTADAARAYALGTQIIVDGVPISNNANLQTDVTILNSSAGASPPFSSVAGRGNDLRQLPADNIENIEVIRGIPSAKYGDLTSGLVIVTSRIGLFKPEIRVRLNPNLAQVATFAGFANRKKNSIYNVGVDVLNAKDDVRDNLNKYTRVQSQLAWQKYWNSKKTFTTTTIASFYKSVDALKPNADDTRTQTENNATDNGLKISTEGKWKANKKWLTTLNYIAAINYSQQQSYYQTLITRDLFPIATAIVDTTQQGVYGKSEYLNKTTVDGKPLNTYVRIEAVLQKKLLEFQHKIMLVAEYRYDVNNGGGRQFNILTPPRQNYSVGERPRTYSAIPALQQIGYYVEDRITKTIGNKRLIVQAGLRIDNVSPTSIFKSKYGILALPRINTAIEVANIFLVKGGLWYCCKVNPIKFFIPRH